MKYNRLGKTDLLVSELGLGCQSLGGGLYYSNKGESLEMVRDAADAGVNFFDTADHYSQGLSEQWLGKALKGRRQDVILATKAGTRYTSLGSLVLAPNWSTTKRCQKQSCRHANLSTAWHHTLFSMDL